MKMIKKIVLVLAAFLGIVSCDKAPDKVYKPPVLRGTAYVLAANTNHIAVVDLLSKELTRLVISKEGADLAVSSAPGKGGIYILAADGSLAFWDPRTAAGKEEIELSWRKVVSQGRSLAAGDQGSLWILGDDELLLQDVSGKEVKRYPLKAAYSSIVYDGAHGALWLISRSRETAVPLDVKTFTLGRELKRIGNSVHRGMMYPGSAELWVAEGNEFRDGKPYGVGFAKKGPAVAGGINILDTANAKQIDFVNVGGNAVDLALGRHKEKVYVAVNRLPYYDEATLSVIGSASKRREAEMRLCLSCHEVSGVEAKEGEIEVRALALFWAEDGK